MELIFCIHTFTKNIKAQYSCVRVKWRKQFQIKETLFSDLNLPIKSPCFCNMNVISVSKGVRINFKIYFCYKYMKRRIFISNAACLLFSAHAKVMLRSFFKELQPRQCFDVFIWLSIIEI